MHMTKKARRAAQAAGKPVVEDITVTRRRVYMLIGIVFGIFAAYQLMTGASQIINTANFLADGIAAEGEVLRIDPLGRNGNVPVVSFTVDGQAFVVTGSADCGSFCPQTGSRVDIIYTQGAPAAARINDFGNLWWDGAINLLISFGALLAAFVALLFSRPPLPGRA
jgi:hypothetical protein